LAPWDPSATASTSPSPRALVRSERTAAWKATTTSGGKKTASGLRRRYQGCCVGSVGVETHRCTPRSGRHSSE
jgi:hypothetical protein